MPYGTGIRTDYGIGSGRGIHHEDSVHGNT